MTRAGGVNAVMSHVTWARMAQSWLMCRWTGGWTPVLVFNTCIIVYFTTIGFGIGGYASIKTFVDKIRTLGVFVDCYQCKKA